MRAQQVALTAQSYIDGGFALQTQAPTTLRHIDRHNTTTESLEVLNVVVHD